MVMLSKKIEEGTFDPIPRGTYSDELIQLQEQMLKVAEEDRPDSLTVLFTINNLKNKIVPKPSLLNLLPRLSRKKRKNMLRLNEL